MDSDDEVQQTPVAVKEKAKYRKEKVVPVDSDVVLLTAEKVPRKKKVPTQKQLDALNANRSKALEKLTEMRRAKREAKENAKKMVEEKILDNAPKVREIDTGMAALKAEMEELKRQLAEKKAEKVVEKVEKVEPEKPKRKVKKVIYEDDDEDVEEIVEVVQRKSQVRPKPITGTDLLDKLFFTSR